MLCVTMLKGLYRIVSLFYVDVDISIQANDRRLGDRPAHGYGKPIAPA